MDLVKQAGDLATAIQRFLENPPAKLAPRTIEALTAIQGQVQGACSALEELAQYTVLEVPERRTYLNNRFADDDTGIFDGARAVALAQASDCLGPLYRGGVDFKSVRRFSPSEIEVARWLGDDFDALAGSWMPFRTHLSKGTNSMEWKGHPTEVPDAVKALLKFLAGLRQHDVISEYRSAFWSFGDNRWVPKPLKEIQRMQSVQRFAVEWVFAEAGGPLARLLTGDWLTAYAYLLCTDHLIRNGHSFEAYTLVKYRAPPEIVRLATDFDLVISTEKRTMLVECKTGKLTDELLQDLQYKAVSLPQALQKVGVRREHSNWLLINPSLAKVDDVQAKMDHLADVTREAAGIDLRIRCLEPSMIRYQLTEDFSR